MALDANQVIKTVYDKPTDSLKVNVVGGSLVPENYDTIDITYVAAGNGAGEIETVTYSLDSEEVAVLTMTYNSDNKLESVVRS